MNSCEDVRKILGAWLDRELDPAKAQAVATHLASCLDCAEERRQLQRLEAVTESVLAERAKQIAFEPFWRGVQERIGAQKTWRGALLDWARSVTDAPSLVWAVPAVIVLIIGAVSLDTLWPSLRGGARNNFAAVESIDSHGRNVALLREDDSKTTVIWLYQNPEGENDASDEPAQSSPSF